MNEKKIIIDYDEFLELQGIKDAQMNKVPYYFRNGQGMRFVLFMDQNEALATATDANYELVQKIQELSYKIEQLREKYSDLAKTKGYKYGED